ncbi:MAG: phosphodiester glycosidase family protein [Deltaproteobacteria bacterium]|nr:phosphodiester glycosidase family protein [Deltaproteobacteria bacterium]
MAVLRCFAGPEPRGGPPAPPEQPWADDFEAFERVRLGDSLDEVADALASEVDRAQAELFARRLRTVDTAIAQLEDPVGRLLRVGLRQRATTIVRAPQARATRIRALADFYYSHVGLHRHRRGHAAGTPLEDRVAAAAWVTVCNGVEHARIEGGSDVGPLHVNLLRIDPSRARLEVDDCRDHVARGGTFADYVQTRGATAAVSGGFFLYSEPDIVAPSKRYDPVGLLVQRGQVLSPPVFRRGALLVDAGGAISIERIGMTAVELEAPDGRRWRPTAVVNRASGRRGPAEASVALVGNTVIAAGHDLAVPLNGFVVAVPPGTSLQVGDRITYRDVQGSRGPVHAGIAGGPVLLEAGRPVLEMRAEDFWGSAPPVTFSQDETGDRNLLPRLAAGLTEDGQLVFAAIDGRNFDRALGMTLAGVARLLLALGCHRATNLDGGSSKRMVVGNTACDLATTEIVSGHRSNAAVRPVHTGVLIFPR